MRRPSFDLAFTRLLVVALCACLPGCYSKVTAHQGKLTFAYASGVEVENFVKPIAPGAKLDVVAFANGTDDELVVTKATSSQRGVLAVDSIDKRKVILKAGEPGVAEIEISARDASGNVLTDKMFFHVAKPTKHGLEHSCTDGSEAAYVRGENVDIFHGLATSDGRPVIGYAYAPLRVEPASALRLVAQPQAAQLYRFRAPSANARVSVRSTVDSGALSLRIVDRGELTDATLDYDDRIVEGRSTYAVAHVRLGETPLCSQNALTKARSLTPEICKVTAKLDDEPDGDSNRWQLATVTGLKFGVCEFEVTLPELAGGRGVVLSGKAKIGSLRFPGDQSVEPPKDSWRLLGLDRAAWSRAGTYWLTSRIAVLAGLFWWLRRRSRVSTRRHPAPASRS
jgi:hypothetical protein